jgi:hypothetical protein
MIATGTKLRGKTRKHAGQIEVLNATEGKYLVRSLDGKRRGHHFMKAYVVEQFYVTI